MPPQPAWGLDDDWEQPAREGRLADAIDAYVRAYDWVTFIELKRRLGRYFELDGSWALEPSENVLVWSDMSKPFIDAIEALLDAERIYPWPASTLAYFIDGGVLNLPLARRVPKAGYTHPHWLPTCLRSVADALTPRRSGKPGGA